MEIYVESLKGQYGQTVLSQKQFFNKRVNTKKYMRLGGNLKTYIRSLKGQYGSNSTASQGLIGQNLLEILKKYNNKPYVFFYKS